MQFCLVCFSTLQHHIQYCTVMLHLENLVPLLSFMLIRHFVECISTGASLDIVLDIQLEFLFGGEETPPTQKTVLPTLYLRSTINTAHHPSHPSCQVLHCDISLEGRQLL